MQESMSLKYEPSSLPQHIYVVIKFEEAVLVAHFGEALLPLGSHP